MSLSALFSAAAAAARALLCPVPGPGCPVPSLAASCSPPPANPAQVRAAGTGSNAPCAGRAGYPGPARLARAVDAPRAPRAPRAQFPGAHAMYKAGAHHDTRAWRASPRAIAPDAHHMSPGAPPVHLPPVTRTPDPIVVTDTRPGVPSVDVCHDRARRTDAARFPLVNVEPRANRPLTLRDRPLGAPFRPYDRPLSILRITDDTNVEMSGRTLVGAVHFYFVIDTWAYDDGDTDVILACERTHQRASRWIDTYGGYV